VRATEGFAAAFAAAGIAVVSGMAMGVDTRAHKAAVETGGLTAAVLGCGADVVYPSANRWLYEKIAAGGAVISELPPGAAPAPWTFPHRNRLLAALGDAVLVVEAPLTSGALQTADAALELGRPVFTVPGSIYAEGYRGCNRLLHDGAGPAIEPCATVEDFLLQTRIERGARKVQGGRLPEANLHSKGGPFGPGSRNDRVWSALRAGPCSVDVLVERTGLAARELSAALAELELEGLTRRVGPGIYARGP
jgi:DNA processing protein